MVASPEPSTPHDITITIYLEDGDDGVHYYHGCA